MQRLLKHAYLYATFSDLPDQLGAILVSPEGIIISAGWNQPYVSEIEIALVTCQHSSEGSTLVTPRPPDLKEASLIMAAGIIQVVYHRAMREGIDTYDTEQGLELLKDNDIEITEIDAHLGCFTLKYNGKDFMP